MSMLMKLSAIVIALVACWLSPTVQEVVGDVIKTIITLGCVYVIFDSLYELLFVPIENKEMPDFH